jgi:ribosomal protein S18
MGRKAKGRSRQVRRRPRTDSRGRKKLCYLCVEKIDYVDYKDVALLRRFTSDRAKIRPSAVTGTCRKHQRRVALAIKNAREMALLPYVAAGKQSADRTQRSRRPRS